MVQFLPFCKRELKGNPKMNIEREWFTPPQISAMTGIKLDNVMGFIHTNELRAVNTAANPNGQRPRWRISKADLETFLASRANKPLAPRSSAPRRRRRKAKASREWV